MPYYHRVMKMNDNKALLTSILNTTQMGQIGIRSALDAELPNSLREAMLSQLKEYDKIETKANSIANQNGWHLKAVNPAVRKMADMMTKARLSYGDKQSKAAAMMIQGNTRGMIIGIKDRRNTKCTDPQVCALSQQLLDTEDANIRQMRGFL